MAQVWALTLPFPGGRDSQYLLRDVCRGDRSSRADGLCLSQGCPNQRGGLLQHSEETFRAVLPSPPQADLWILTFQGYSKWSPSAMACVFWEKVTHWWLTPAHELAPSKTCNAGTPAQEGQPRAALEGLTLERFCSLDQARQGLAWRQGCWVRWRRREGLTPGPFLCFIASILFPHDATDQREEGNAATFVLEFAALTFSMFMQERNVWARQVKHLLADTEWDNTNPTHGCQGGIPTYEWNCGIFLDIP